MKTTLYILLLLVFLFFVIINHPKFGKISSGNRLERIRKSPHFKNGKFENLNHTPQITEGVKITSIIKDNFTAKNKKPLSKIPSVKTDLKKLDRNEDVLIWFGHSSYFIQLEGKRILVDPVFSGSASPFPFMIKAFEGTDVYEPEDIPEIDYLIITHDHWDHLDYKTIRNLRPKVREVITGLGVGAHFEHWGFDEKLIQELDWFEDLDLGNGFKIYGTPARHFSGRGVIPKKTIWMSFVFQSSQKKIFIGGDGGYDSHFAEIGKRFGEFDLAILENGQYNQAWKYIHMTPEQVLQASKDLNSKRVFPVHSMKFALANHTWDEPLNRITKANKTEKVPLITPKIGELVYLNNEVQQFSEWWKDIK